MKNYVEQIKEEVRTSAYFKTAKDVKNIFVDSAMKQISDENTIMLAAIIGLSQGLKYNGNLKRGVKAGAATLMVLGSVNGVANVLKNAEIINAKHKLYKRI